MSIVFLALCLHPDMQSPHLMQPVRLGPSPPKYGSSTSTPGVPKYTPTGVEWNVSPTPISWAMSRMMRSGSVRNGTSLTPSMRSAWS